MRLRKKSYLYLALALPILMLFITCMGVFFLQLSLHPKYNFIYAQVNIANDYACELQLQHQLRPDAFPLNFKLPGQNPNLDCSKINLYLYDFNSQESKPLTPAQAQKYIFSNNTQKSPDGFIVQPYCSAGNSIGWWNTGTGDYGVCLRKNHFQQRLNLKGPHDLGAYYNHFIFLGWILGERQPQK